MDSYEILADCRVSIADALLGSVTAEWTKGDQVKPANEAERRALARLVATGAARASTGAKRAQRDS